MTDRASRPAGAGERDTRDRRSRNPYARALGLIWGLPLLLTVGGYAAMWLFFGPEDPQAEGSDRVDPGFLVAMVGLMAAPYLLVAGLAAVAWIAWRRARAGGAERG